MTKEEIRMGVDSGMLLAIGTWSAEQLEKEEDILSVALHLSMERLGWECIRCPHETFQWVGTEMCENEDGSLSIFVKVTRNPKENPEYDERTKNQEVNEDDRRDECESK